MNLSILHNVYNSEALFKFKNEIKHYIFLDVSQLRLIARHKKKHQYFRITSFPHLNVKDYLKRTST